MELRSRGWRVTTVECASKHQPTIQADVVAWVRYRSRGYIKAHGVPDAVVAGPPCCTRSTEAWGRHREVGTGTGKPTSAEAQYADEREVAAVWLFVQRCIQLNPSIVYVLENPDTVAWAQVPVLQPHRAAQEFRHVNYGDYGWPLLKPTCLVTNMRWWRQLQKVAKTSEEKWCKVPGQLKPRMPPLLTSSLADAMCAPAACKP